jgi:hypothetical protein
MTKQIVAVRFAKAHKKFYFAHTIYYVSHDSHSNLLRYQAQVMFIKLSTAKPFMHSI